MEPDKKPDESKPDDKPAGFTQEQVDKMIRDAVETQTAGLKKNRDDLIAEKKALEGKANPFLALGIDPEEAEEAVKFVKSQDFKKMIAAGDFEKLEAEISKTTTTKVEKEWKSRLEKEETEKKKALEERDFARSELKKLRVTDRIREAALKGGVDPKAVDSAILHGDKLFDLDDKGLCVAIRDGVQVPGKDGPLTPEEWVTENLLKDHPYLRARTEGPGGPGSDQAGKTDTGKNPWSKEHWNLTEQGREITKNRENAMRLAAQAGKPMIAGQ